MNYKDNNVISLYENNIAFHTFEIKRNFDKDSFEKVFNYMTERYLCNNITKPNKKGYYMFWDFCDITGYKGVNVTLQRPAIYVKNKFFVYSLKIRVNPRLLIDYENKENETNYFGVFECNYDNILKLIKKLNNLLYDIGLVSENDTDYWIESFGNIENFTLSRMDFCTNVILKNAEMVSAYFKLLSRGDIYNNVNAEIVRDKAIEKFSMNENALIYKFSSFTLSIYNKIEQMIDINREQLIPEEFKGFLRIEMSVNERKIKYIYGKYDKYDSGLAFVLLNGSREAKKQFERYIKKQFKKGAYMNLCNAKEYIEMCCNDGIIKGFQKDELINFMETVAQKRSLFNTRINMNKHTYKRYIKLLDEIKLNPVTIPERWNNNGKAYRYLPSLYTVLGFENDELFKE